MAEKLPYLARKVMELREAAGLSMYELAKRAGLTNQSLSLIEKGQRGANWETIQRLSKVLGVSCEAFADPGLDFPEQPDEPPKRGRPPKASTPAEKPARKRKKGE